MTSHEFVSWYLECSRPPIIRNGKFALITEEDLPVLMAITHQVFHVRGIGKNSGSQTFWLVSIGGGLCDSEARTKIWPLTVLEFLGYVFETAAIVGPNTFRIMKLTIEYIQHVILPGSSNMFIVHCTTGNHGIALGSIHPLQKLKINARMLSISPRAPVRSYHSLACVTPESSSPISTALSREIPAIVYVRAYILYFRIRYLPTVRYADSQ